MASRPKSPSAQRRLIALTLKYLREHAGKDMKDVATIVDRNVSWVSRAERAEMTPGTSDLKAMLEFYGLDPHSAQVQAVVAVARLARKRGGWWHSYAEFMPKDFGDFVGLETAASTISEYEDALVPGLLQTEDYARATMLASRMPSEADIRQKLAVRVNRQRLLEADDPPELRMVLDEGVVRREIGGPKVMRGQIEHLVEMAERYNHVKVQVLPYRSGAHPGLDGPFTILDFPPPPDGYPDTPQPRLIYIESMMNAWYLEKPEEITAYDLAWDDIRSLALTPADSIGMLRSIADDLGKTR